MGKTFLSLPYEIKYKIFAEVLGDRFDFVFKSGMQVREVREKAVTDEWDDDYCLLVRVVPTRVPTRYLLVSREVKTVAIKVASDMDKLASQKQSEVTNDIVLKGGLPACSYYGWGQVFDQLWDDKKPSRIILAHHPPNPWHFLAQVNSMASVKSIYFTKAVTNWGYRGFEKLWYTHYPHNGSEIASWISIFLSANFPVLETIAIGVGKKVSPRHKSGLPIVQMLRWLRTGPRNCLEYQFGLPRLEAMDERNPRYRSLELIFEKKGKGIEVPLDLNSYCMPPFGYKWVKKISPDSEITGRGRYINEWDDFNRVEICKEEEGDVLKIQLGHMDADEMYHLEEDEMFHSVFKCDGACPDTTGLFETFPKSITTVFE
ncbi:hypothetical protein TWF679_000366 [Orbilia oligospora]|uniref:F-box domain-containing protein n=1 Tax=Orbilia oligospora TaxID=2813651 RepID=A0A8H8VI20_ORBOL|nr:hypothetical protein TWF679_000366 [Orbilia oligospora]